jgi:hypothetical protein
MFFRWEYPYRLSLAGQHILLKFHTISAVRVGDGDTGHFEMMAKTIVKPDAPVFIAKNRRVKRHTGPGSGFQPPPAGFPDSAVVFIFPRRTVADRDGNIILGSERIVEVESTVTSPDNIGSLKGFEIFAGIIRVLILAVYGAFVPPVCNIIQRGGPADVIFKAIMIPARTVMGTEDVHPFPQNPGFAVRDVFIAG